MISREKTLAIFAGSKNICNEDSEILFEKLYSYFNDIKDDIDNIIYGGGDSGVMGIVYETAIKAGITIKGMSLEKYREYDEGKDIEMFFYENDDKRLEGFYKKGSIFLALPGGLGTFREILTINELIKRNNELKKIFIPSFFKSFYNLINELERENMIADEDKGNIIKINNFSEIKL